MKLGKPKVHKVSNEGRQIIVKTKIEGSVGAVRFHTFSDESPELTLAKARDRFPGLRLPKT